MPTFKSYLLKFFLGGTIIALPLLQIQINSIWMKHYSPKKLGLVEGLSPDHYLLALGGLREFVASVLWVKGDAFFHEGNYDAMLPILKLATVLDPHNIEIYSTGMWHMAYNFTDSDHRSDRRYLPSALAFAAEGVKNNPDSYQLFFDLGHLWFQKIEDNPQRAVDWFYQACSKPDILTAKKSMLAHAYIRNNEIMKALNVFEKLLQEVKNDPESFDSQVETIENNIDNLLIRSSERGFFAPGSKDCLTYPSIDPQLTAKIKVIAPRKIEIQGQIQLPFQGLRIKLILKEKKFPGSRDCGADWEQIQSLPLEDMLEKTFLQDQMYVKNGKFKTVLDLDKDPGIYPLTGSSYILEIFYDPRYAPAAIQNRIGVNGEGLEGKDIHSTYLLGRKILHVHCELSRDQILRENRWQDKTPMIEIPSFNKT